MRLGSVVHPRAAVTVVFFADGALFASWISRIPTLSDRVGASPGLLGLILLAPAVAGALAMPLAARALARGSSRRVSRLALFALMIAVPLPGLAHASWSLAASLLLLGFAGATLDVSMNAQGVTVERHLAKPILSSLHAAFSFGGFAGAGGGAIAAGLGISPLVHLLIAAALFGIPGLVATLALHARDDDPDAEAPHLRWRALPTRLIILGIACFFGLLAEGAAGDWSAKLVRAEPLGSATAGALAYAAFSVGMAAGRLAADRLWMRWGSAGLILRGGSLAAAGLTAGLVIGDAPAEIAGFLILGLGLSSNVPTLFRAAAAETGVAAGSALAAVSSLGYVGFLIGPPVIGGLAQLTSLRLACGLLGLSALVVAALAPFAQTRRPTRPDAPLEAPV
jgi:predicted MFS family arabinose efflux permease